jgi:hypothetical protein
MLTTIFSYNIQTIAFNFDKFSPFATWKNMVSTHSKEFCGKMTLICQFSKFSKKLKL